MEKHPAKFSRRLFDINFQIPLSKFLIVINKNFIVICILFINLHFLKPQKEV